MNAIISALENVNSQLQGEFIKLHEEKESIIVKRRKPVIEGILKHLKQLEKEPTAKRNIMVDAETGFGKTYDIGMWSHVLAKAGSHHLVAVPSNQLVGQAEKMIRETFDINIETPKTVQELKDVIKNATGPVTIIVTHDLLLQQGNDREFKDQKGEKPNMWISIDEADSIDEEDLFKNMCKLDEICPITFLTATIAKRRILNRCGEIISPERSKKRCNVRTTKAIDVITKTNKKEKFVLALAVNAILTIAPAIIFTPIVMKYVTVQFAAIGIASDVWLYSLFISSLAAMVSSVIIAIVMLPVVFTVNKVIGVDSKDLILRIVTNIYSLVNNEKSSPAHEYVEECEEAFNYYKVVDTDDVLTSVRWNIQSPKGENALILADEIDNIVNLSFALHGEDNKVYENGKIYTRYKVYDKFRPEEKFYKNYRIALCKSNFINCVKGKYSNLTDEQISELTQKVDFSGTAKHRVMHSMIDLTLSYLMKCDNIALDERRQKDFNLLMKDVRANVNDVNDADENDNDNDIVSFLKEKGFSEQFARNELLPQIKAVISGLKGSDDENRKLIVDNWNLSKDLHNLIEKGGVLHGLSGFCEKNKCVFAGLGKNDLGIEENKPFFKITHNDGGKYSIEDCDYSKEDIDNLAKYALTTIIDKPKLKGRGFDSEYNHVASIFTDSCNPCNDPSVAVQNIGRNREKNPNRQPWFFAVAGEKTELFIDKVLANLNSNPKNFCEKILFPASDKYNELLIDRMGVERGKAIEDYISRNVDALGNINEIALTNFSENLIKKMHKKVSDINDFDKDKTEEDLDTVLESTKKYLSSYEDRIRNNGKLSLGNRAMFFTAGVILKVFYYSWFAFDYIIFVAKSLTLNEKDDKKEVLTYDYVVKNYNIESVLRSGEIFDNANEAAENIYQKFSKEFHKDNKLTECMGKIANLFNNEVYINRLDKLLSPFLKKKGGEKHLLAILNTIYPNEDNESQLKQISGFKKVLESQKTETVEDLKSQKTKMVVSKYCQGNTYDNTDLCKIVGWIKDINKEVIKCQAYYHNVDHLIKSGRPKLQTDHHMFNVRAVYSKETFFNNSYTHPVFTLFAMLVCVARYVILIMLIPDLLRFIMPEIIPNLLSWPLVTLCCLYPEKFRTFLFNEKITNDSLPEVNELTVISKQSEAGHMNKIADRIIPNYLNLIELQSPMELQV